MKIIELKNRVDSDSTSQSQDSSKGSEVTSLRYSCNWILKLPLLPHPGTPRATFRSLADQDTKTVTRLWLRSVPVTHVRSADTVTQKPLVQGPTLHTVGSDSHSHLRANTRHRFICPSLLLDVFKWARGDRFPPVIKLQSRAEMESFFGKIKSGRWSGCIGRSAFVSGNAAETASRTSGHIKSI